MLLHLTWSQILNQNLTMREGLYDLSPDEDELLLEDDDDSEEDELDDIDEDELNDLKARIEEIEETTYDRPSQ